MTTFTKGELFLLIYVDFFYKIFFWQMFHIFCAWLTQALMPWLDIIQLFRNNVSIFYLSHLGFTLQPIEKIFFNVKPYYLFSIICDDAFFLFELNMS